MYYKTPGLGLWWWFYNTPKQQRVLKYHNRLNGKSWWSNVHFLTDNAARSWWMDAIERTHTGANYDDAELFSNSGQGWTKTY